MFDFTNYSDLDAFCMIDYIPLREENLLHAGRRKQRSNHPRGGKNISDDTHVFIE